MYYLSLLAVTRTWWTARRCWGLLSEAGYTIVEEEEQADAIVINTCCFIHDAKEESIETIIEMASWKEKGAGTGRSSLRDVLPRDTKRRLERNFRRWTLSSERPVTPRS